MGNAYVAFVQGTPRSLPGRTFVAKTLQGSIFIDFGLFGKRFWKDVGPVLFLCWFTTCCHKFEAKPTTETPLTNEVANPQITAL